MYPTQLAGHQPPVRQGLRLALIQQLGAISSMQLAKAFPASTSPFGTYYSVPLTTFMRALLYVTPFDSALNQKWVIDTTVATIAKAQVSPDDQTVYCLEPNGSVHSIEADTGMVHWTAVLTEGAPAHLADFAQSKNGKYLYFNNQGGTLTAWQVADDVPSPPQPSGNPILAPISTMPVIDTPAPYMFCGLRNDLCLMNSDCCSNSCQPQPGQVAGVCTTAKTANKNAQKFGTGMGGAGNQGKRD